MSDVHAEIAKYENEGFPIRVAEMWFGDDIVVGQRSGKGGWCVFRFSDGAYLRSDGRWCGVDEMLEGHVEVRSAHRWPFAKALQLAARAYVDSVADD